MRLIWSRLVCRKPQQEGVLPISFLVRAEQGGYPISRTSTLLAPRDLSSALAAFIESTAAKVAHSRTLKLELFL